MNNPFIVPPLIFEQPRTKYLWYSWHPLYPFWARYCYEANTEEEALAMLNSKKHKGTLEYYHNKLVRYDGACFLIIADFPCKRLDVWRAIRRKMSLGELAKVKLAS
jgi:hypothetical protein